jgi:hypothetical protein
MDGRILLPEMLLPALAMTMAGNGALAQTPAAASQPVAAQNQAHGPASPRPGTGAGPPPPYTALRWNEDYSYLRDSARHSDRFDPIKYIPVGDDPDTYLSLGGSVRYRYEFFDNNTFGAGPQDDDGFHLTRILAHADLHLGKNLRGFVQIKSAMEDGREGGPRPIDSDEFDLQQAFVDLKLPISLGDESATVTLRAGRQDLMYGVQRLIGPLDWANTRRTFEGGKASFTFSKTHALDVFLVRPVVVENEEPNTGDGNVTFGGLYDTVSLPNWLGETAATKLDLYGLVLLVNRPGAFSVPFPVTGPDEDRYTVGARLSSTQRPWDFDIEATYQFGKLGGGNISAWSIASEVGYTLAEAPLTPRLILGFDMASGDDDPTDADSQTFNQLFPTGHPFFGYLDAIGRQNAIDLHAGAELTLLKEAKLARKVTLRAQHHMFWRQSDDDAVYNTAGGVLRADFGSDETYIGSETDLLLNWQIDRHWSAYAGYSHFFAGDFLQETGPGDDIDWFYAAVQFTF